MHIEKFLFFLPAAVDHVCHRLRISHVPPSLLYLLWAVKRLPRTARLDLLRHAAKVGRPMKTETIKSALQDGVKFGLLTIEDGQYKLTPTGLEFIARINRYIRHKRLR
jgi:hypothetical protein